MRAQTGPSSVAVAESSVASATRACSFGRAGLIVHTVVHRLCMIPERGRAAGTLTEP